MNNFSVIHTGENSTVQFSIHALTFPFPASATGTNRFFYKGFIAADGGVAPTSNPHGSASHTHKVILSSCLSFLGRDPGFQDVLVKAFACVRTTTLPPFGGVPPHHTTYLLRATLVASSFSHQVRPRATTLPPESFTVAEDLARRDDWSDLGLQADLALNASGHHTPEQRELLATALEKIKAPVGSSFTNTKYWAKQAAWNDYDSLASIVACSTYARREDFIHCGHGRFSCQDRMLCPRCVYNFMARRVQEEFGQAFTADPEVYYLVISLSRDPDETHRLKYKGIGEDDFRALKHRIVEEPHIITPGQAGDYGIGFDGFDNLLQCRALWHFNTEAIREFTGNERGRLFSGVVGGPELAVQLYPLRVLPHANYIAWTPGFSVDGAREIRRFIRTKMRDCRRVEQGLFPSVACYRLRTADDLLRVISYIFKPIDLASAYTRAAELAGYAPAVMEGINSEVNVFLTNALDIFWQLRRVARFGRCHSSHHDYLGQDSAYRLAQREAAAARRAAGLVKHSGSDIHPVARWQMHHLDVHERTQWPRQSRFERWKSQFDQSTPLPMSVPGFRRQS